jgi:hypothetical protein
MNEVIKLAIEKGGYKTQPSYDLFPATSEPYILLDPLFWQALGRALGWGPSMWLYMALPYFKVRLTGASEENFWVDLLNHNINEN